ncbi:haloacid dehalogenase-like hydrolase [Comamonas sp. GB3 AK4-5]|uniref:haloacid dehalogenase-like hydrolase n=1 Tax=Comamonas sp. GB3 AK4-5 TaxID=3231487 RepID=UPI00351E9B5A
MIQQLGKSSPGFDATHPPYAVFDWDNTSIFLDIEEAVLVYQLEHLRFGATPQQLEVALRRNIPSTAFKPEYRNSKGREVNINTIVPDILRSYRWLYSHYQGLAGTQPLEQVRQSPHYQAFVTKVRYLYEAIGGTFDHDTAYPWVTYLFTGLTEAEVRSMTRETVQWQLEQPIEKRRWTTPAQLPGRAGMVEVSWKNGLRLVPEMQNLYAHLRDAGFDIWICSASFVDVVREIASNPSFGYQQPSDRVLAMELERDAQGRIQPIFRKTYDQTQGPGKTRAIQRFLVSRYGYGPALVAGDSEGDQNMMAGFADTKKVLIINRLRDPSTAIGQFSAEAVRQHGKPEARYLLQGRDDNSGQFVPSQLHTPLQSATGKVLP